MKKLLWSLAGLILTGLLVWRILAAVSEKEALRNESAAERIVPVEVGTMVPLQVENRITATGTLAAASEVTVYSKVAGRLVKNLVEMNDAVAAGQVVSLLDRDEAGYEYNQVEIRGNASGTVAKVFQNPGAAITPSTPLLLIVNVESVKAVVSVREDKIRFVRKGLPVAIALDAWPEDRFTGRVTNISPIANPATRAVDVEVTIPNPGHRLKPGMFVRATLIVGARRVNGLPITAITEYQGKPVAFVVRDSVAHRTPVATGESAGGFLEITGGLDPADQVVLIGAQRLNHRDKVTVMKKSTNS